MFCVIVTGRGRLYHWGPNHAGDPVVTRYVFFSSDVSKIYCKRMVDGCRWKRDSKGSIVYQRREGEDYSKPVLQFVAIQRRDTKQWALPGVRERKRDDDDDDDQCFFVCDLGYGGSW